MIFPLFLLVSSLHILVPLCAAYDVSYHKLWCNIHRKGPRKAPVAVSVSETPAISRRSAMTGFLGAVILISSNISAANAVSDEPDPSPNQTKANTDVTVEVEDFSFSIPSNWKIITKPPSSNEKITKKKPMQTLFSAIDFQSGSVLTVVQEQACNVQEYAQSQNACDVVLPSGKVLFSEETLPKDLSKLIIRHDDRDNAALQGTTKLNSYQLEGANQNIVNVVATTTIPSGGAYRDTMGIDRLSTIDRDVRAKVVVLDQSSQGKGTRILSLWLSAPSDEWQKPIMGFKLNEIWKNVIGQTQRPVEDMH